MKISMHQADSDVCFHTLKCLNCNKTLEVKAFMNSGFSEHEMVICPICKSDVDEIRADNGYRILNIE
ncbi:MAG: hypothetical protein ACYDEJ_11185 [Desulfitobacteriaceae bacterium]